jgi:diguanylate cyclase (GGDEF)-like protein
MFDLDRFKQINDQYGHDAGDKALTLVASKCQQLLRPTDVLGRIGGDEFAVFLLDTDSKSALKAAERLRKGIEKIKFSINKKTINLSGSFGVHTSGTWDDNINEILKRADQSMYHAKQLGGNRIVHSDSLASNAPRTNTRRHEKNH